MRLGRRGFDDDDDDGRRADTPEAAVVGGSAGAWGTACSQSRSRSDSAAEATQSFEAELAHEHATTAFLKRVTPLLERAEAAAASAGDSGMDADVGLDSTADEDDEITVNDQGVGPLVDDSLDRQRQQELALAKILE
ncbi:hypothetical protein HK405_007004, partial [Cladochytrium tenue]